MPRINSKAKGRRGELDTCKILNDRFGYGKKIFSPTPQSGAWGGGQNREKREDMSLEQRIALVSDIMTPTNFKFVIENKNYAEFDFWNLFNERSEINDWTDQVTTDADSVGKNPLLIMKFNRHQRISMTRQSTKKEKFIWYDSRGRDWYCLLFDDLLKLSDEYFYSKDTVIGEN